jgi:hypothetical protein
MLKLLVFDLAWFDRWRLIIEIQKAAKGGPPTQKRD